MKKYIIMISLIILGFILQTSFLVFFNHFNIIPNISLILLVIFAILSDGLTGGLLGFLTGLLYDTMIYDVFGIYTLIYFFIGALIGNYSDEILKENYFASSVITGISTLVMNSFLYLILFFLRFRVQSALSFLPGMLVETGLNSIFVIFVLKFVLFLFDKFNVKV